MIKNYNDCIEYLKKGKNHNDRLIANNTRIQRIDDNTIGIKLHNTFIIKYYKDDTIVLNTGGWITLTTRNRMNKFSPFNIYIKKGTMFVDCYSKTYEFFNSILISCCSHVSYITE